MKRRVLVLLALCLTLWSPCRARADQDAGGFYLHDGDTVVIYGDSITEQQMYGRDIETYVVTRFPNMHVKFINSGWSGDRVTGGGGGNIALRLKRDVLPYKPTVVTILLGMNDGTYTGQDDSIYQTYTHGLTHIVDELQQKLPGVRITLLTPSMFDYAAKDRPAKPAGQGYNYAYPAPDYNDVLIRYGDFIKKMGAERGLTVADINAPMVDATNKGRQADSKFALSGDGVHPNEIGHLLMAAAVLRAWHAPSGTADIKLTPGQSASVTAPLPWPVPMNVSQAFAVSPLPGVLDGYHLHADNLTQDRYTLTIDGMPVGTFTREQLTEGINLTSLDKLPENAQAKTVYDITEKRIARWHMFFKGNNFGIAQSNDIPSDQEIAALKSFDSWLDASRQEAYKAAQPRAHTYLLMPAAAQ